ncbi:MAG: RDD family protein [Microbacteriaceae bacterium]
MTQPPKPDYPVTASSSWPGQRLGLPESGPRSIARLGRRLAALSVDWLIASIIAYAVFAGEALAITAVFGTLQALVVMLFGCSIGHYALGLRVVPLSPGPVGIWRPVVRAILLTIVIPAVIWDVDQRGLHDKVAGTILVRR